MPNLSESHPTNHDNIALTAYTSSNSKSISSESLKNKLSKSTIVPKIIKALKSCT
jgi:hypothetical protein